MVISIRCRWLINHFFSLSSLSLRDDEDVGVACCFLLFPSSSLFSIILNTDFFFFFYSHHCDWSRSHCWPKLENKGLSLSFVCPPLSSSLSFILWLDSRGTRWGFFFLFFFSPIHWWLYTALSAFFFLFFSSFEQQNRSNKRPVGRSVWLVLYFVVVI